MRCFRRPCDSNCRMEVAQATIAQAARVRHEGKRRGGESEPGLIVKEKGLIQFCLWVERYPFEPEPLIERQTLKLLASKSCVRSVCSNEIDLVTIFICFGHGYFDGHACRRQFQTRARTLGTCTSRRTLSRGFSKLFAGRCYLYRNHDRPNHGCSDNHGQHSTFFRTMEQRRVYWIKEMSTRVKNN